MQENPLNIKEKILLYHSSLLHRQDKTILIKLKVLINTTLIARGFIQEYLRFPILGREYITAGALLCFLVQLKDFSV